MSSQTLLIDSYDRIEGTSTAFRINLNQVKENIESIQLVSAIIPNTAYNVYNYTINGILYQNNLIPFREVASDAFATVPIGNYSITNLIAAIGVAMTSSSPNLQVYTASYDSSTFKITVTTSGPNPFAFRFAATFGGTNYTNINLSYVMGFNNTNTGVAALSLTSNNVVNLSGIPYYVIKNNNLQNNVFTTEATSGMYYIPNNVNGANIAYYLCSTEKDGNIMKFNKGSYTTLTQLNISLMDTYERIVDLNGADWQFCIKINYYNY